jgi:hypothetical protein
VQEDNPWSTGSDPGGKMVFEKTKSPMVLSDGRNFRKTRKQFQDHSNGIRNYKRRLTTSINKDNIWKNNDLLEQRELHTTPSTGKRTFEGSCGIKDINFKHEGLLCSSWNSLQTTKGK